MEFTFGKGPMLCKVFNPDKHVINKAMYLEPKYDGLRGIVVVTQDTDDSPKLVQVLSRNGKPLWNTELIQEEIAQFPVRNVVFDGEFYTQDWNLSMSITKTQTPHPDRDKLQFHVWDCVDIGDWNNGVTLDCLELRQRFRPLINLEQAYGTCPHVKAVVAKVVHSFEEAQAHYTEFLAQGFEGGILKDPASQYQLGKRSPGWLKLKPWHDADLTITGAYAGLGKHDGRLGGLVLAGEVEWKGELVQVTTEVGTGFSDEQRETYQVMWDNQTLIGMVAEIKFQEITGDHACRFPVFNRLREDK